MRSDRPEVNLSNLMKRAHEIRREGKNMSAAMKQAWVEFKIEIIDQKIFMLRMNDSWSSSRKPWEIGPAGIIAGLNNKRMLLQMSLDNQAAA